MATLVIGAGLVGSQVARLLVEQGATPVLMDSAPQREALAEILSLDRVRLIEGDVLRPFALTQAIREHDITEIVHRRQSDAHHRRAARSLCRHPAQHHGHGQRARGGARP